MFHFQSWPIAAITAMAAAWSACATGTSAGAREQVPDAGIRRDGENVVRDARPESSEALDAGLADTVTEHVTTDTILQSADTMLRSATWVTIPAGTFTMGSPGNGSCRYSDEDQHHVTLTRSFEIQATEVTQRQFEALMGYNPSTFKNCGANCPVETVNWHEAVAYCNALSAQAALAPCYTCNAGGASVTCDVASAYAGANIYACPGYRLPTDAEWEYAYRAGTQKAYYRGDNDPSACGCSPPDTNLSAIAWYCANSGETPHPVGQKQGNKWHLYDMAGNVSEWCHDWYAHRLGNGAVSDPWGLPSARYRVLRGGSWSFEADFARAADRDDAEPTSRFNDIGFRCVRGSP